MSPPPRRRRGGLSPEDRAVWEIIARQVRPLQPVPTPRAPERDGTPAHDAAIPPPTPEPRAAPSPGAASPAALFAAERSGGARLRSPGPVQGSVSFDLHDPAPVPVGRPEAGLDRRTAERLRRGERAPDARVDLHGMTAERAHRVLDRFIADAVARGLRCVLVITGKGGRRAPDRDDGFMRPDRGVLRQDAPRWLRAGPAAHEIVGIYEAHRRHGGEGAFYVYLKKRR